MYNDFQKQSISTQTKLIRKSSYVTKMILATQTNVFIIIK